MAENSVLHKGLDAFIDDLCGFCKRSIISTSVLRRISEEAYAESLLLSELPDAAFDKDLMEIREQIRLGRSSTCFARALAYVSEAAYRTLSIRPYSVQIMGAIVLLRNQAIQMETGEGKTITAALAAVFSGWRGGGCHLVTSNDYLAKRDAGLMSPLYQRCGLRVGYVVAGFEPLQRKDAYLCDITYSTSKELLADFLRDKLAAGTESSDASGLIESIGAEAGIGTKVMRGLCTAIIDEADSVLADEANGSVNYFCARQKQAVERSCTGSV